MKNFASRSNIADSATLKINAMVNELKNQGKEVIPFVAGEPDFNTPDEIKNEAINAIHNNYTHYTNSAGIPELRKAIVNKLKNDNNLKYDINQIVVSCGGKQALANTLLALVEKGDEVIIPAPYWVSYLMLVQLTEATPIIIETTLKNNYRLTIKQLKENINSKTKLLILNSPSNPTGSVYSKKELDDIAQICIDNDLFVISDEIYEKLIYDGNKHYSIAQHSEEMKKRTIIINGFSKSHAMTGWRVGYSACSPDISKSIKKIQANMSSHTSSISQYASLGAFKVDESYETMLKDVFSERRDIIINKLSNLNYLKPYRPEGAFYVFIDVSELFNKYHKDLKIINDEDVFQILLEEYGVALVPGNAFGNNKCLRMSYSYSTEAINKGLSQIEKFINNIK